MPRLSVWQKNQLARRQRKEANEAVAKGVQKPEAVEEPEVVEPVVSDDAPDSSWLKADIQDWLDEHEVEWELSMTKDELLALVD